LRKKEWPPLNADKRELQRSGLSALIGVHLRLESVLSILLAQALQLSKAATARFRGLPPA
jgi:hypothetical protein